MDSPSVSTHTSLCAALTALETVASASSGIDAVRELDRMRVQWTDASFAAVLNNTFSVLPGMRSADLMWIGLSLLVARATPASVSATFESKWQYSSAGLEKLRSALHARSFGLDTGTEPLLQAVALATHTAGVAWHLDDETESDDRAFVRLSAQVFMRNIAVRLDPLMHPGVSISLDHHALVPCLFLDRPAPACPPSLECGVVNWLIEQLDFRPPGRLLRSAKEVFYALALPLGAVASARRAGSIVKSLRILFELSIKDPVVIEPYRLTCNGTFADALARIVAQPVTPSHNSLLATGDEGGRVDRKLDPSPPISKGEFPWPKGGTPSKGGAQLPQTKKKETKRGGLHRLRAERLWQQAVALSLFDYILANQELKRSWLQSHVVLDHARTEAKSIDRLTRHQYLGRPCRPVVVVVLSRWFVYQPIANEWIACQDAIHAIGVWVKLLDSNHDAELECGYNFRSSVSLSAFVDIMREI